jgi:hypothetical protein
MLVSTAQRDGEIIFFTKKFPEDTGKIELSYFAVSKINCNEPCGYWGWYSPVGGTVIDIPISQDEDKQFIARYKDLSKDLIEKNKINYFTSLKELDTGWYRVEGWLGIVKKGQETGYTQRLFGTVKIKNQSGKIVILESD